MRVRAKFVREHEGDGRFWLESFSSPERTWGAREAIREVLTDADACGWLDVDVPEVAPFALPAVETLVVAGEIRWVPYQNCDGGGCDPEFEITRLIRAEVFPEARSAVGRALALRRASRQA